MVLCNNQRTVLTPPRLSFLLLAATLFPLGCHAQLLAPQGKPLPAATAFRVESLLRRKADLPPGSTVNIGPVMPSSTNGFGQIAVSFTNEGRTSPSLQFLISDDGKTLEQITPFNIGGDPKTLISAEGRPSRGGPANAPIVIVGFDDLECPYCARMHAEIFPAIQKRYGDQVHIVYKDFPLEQHPWAMRAAVDVNCLAAESPAGYWDVVDAIHARAAGIGSDPTDAKSDPTLERATQQLDGIVREEGLKQKVDMTALNACVAKQDTAAIEASKTLATSFNVQSTPTLFINGDKIDGAVPLPFLFGVIDEAMRAEGVTPPPPYVDPAAAPEPPAAMPKGR